jgi:hypothetical protein
MGVGGQRHAPAALPPGQGPGTCCTGDWVCPRAVLDGCRPDLSARSESVYRLRYPDPLLLLVLERSLWLKDEGLYFDWCCVVHTIVTFYLGNPD